MKLLFNKPFKKVNKDLSFKSNSVQVFPDLNLEPGRLSNPFFYYSGRSIGINNKLYMFAIKTIRQ